MSTHRIVIYGKGGIGKSTIATNLSVLYAMAGKRVLHIGCDPKADSTLKLQADDGPAFPSVLDALLRNKGRVLIEDIVGTGRHGIDIIEAGGPPPGTGCGGRGVARMFELLEQLKLFRHRSYDVVLYDVLGDVVCGGFAAPLRKGISERVYVVTSEEVMSLYAANNIARAAQAYARNDITLGGWIVNLRENDVARAPIEALAERIGTRVLAYLERDPLVREAEYAFRTVVEHAPEAPVSRALRQLADELLDPEGPPGQVPTPLSPEAFRLFVRATFTAPTPRRMPPSALPSSADPASRR